MRPWKERKAASSRRTPMAPWSAAARRRFSLFIRDSRPGLGELVVLLRRRPPAGRVAVAHLLELLPLLLVQQLLQLGLHFLLNCFEFFLLFVGQTELGLGPGREDRPWCPAAAKPADAAPEPAAGAAEAAAAWLAEAAEAEGPGWHGERLAGHV